MFRLMGLDGLVRRLWFPVAGGLAGALLFGSLAVGLPSFSSDQAVVSQASGMHRIYLPMSAKFADLNANPTIGSTPFADRLFHQP